ncbi:MAG: hypothetical protein HFI88_10265 [Lachnospiraceae bacterium]|nr:hypothetical protein [Lachnospiraceae bacterium]
MKMKLKDVNRHYAGLAGAGDLILPSKLSFAISRNMESLLAEVERAEKERKKMCERYAEKDADGKPVMADSVVDGKKTREYKMSPEGMKTVNEEYQALLDAEVDVRISTVDAECIRQCEESERYSIPSVRQAAALAFMLEK